MRHPGATVDDLAEALGLAGAGPLTVDGRVVAGTTPVADAGLVAGSEIAVGGGPGAVSAGGGGGGPAFVRLDVVGGLVAGRSVGLAAGEHVLGRDGASSVVVDHGTVSSSHCVLVVPTAGGAVTVRDLGSLNGTWVDGVEVGDEGAGLPLAPGAVLRTGAVLWRVAPVAGSGAGDRAPLPQARAGRIPFNRPPRVAGPPAPAPLAPPSTPAPAPARNPFSWVGLLAPLVAAGAMVAILGDARYALFALVSPVMVVGSWIEGRRRSRRLRRTSSRDLAVAMDRFRADLAAAAGAEAARLAHLLPDPAECARRAEAPATSLWHRRRDDPDLLALHLGIGSPRWPAPLVDTRSAAPEAVQAAGAVVLEGAPVGADLVTDGALGVVGDRSAALVVARSLVLQAATHAGPADLAVAVLTTEERRRAWEFAAWLPHGPGRVLTDPVDIAAASAGDGLLVVDGEAVLAQPAVRRALEEVRPAVVLAAAATQLPALCRVVVEVGADGDASLTRPLEGSPPEVFLAAGVPAAAAVRWARWLARFRDPRVEAGEALPALPAGALLGAEAFDAHGVARRWGAGSMAGVPLGVDEDGVVSLDLRSPGPVRVVGSMRTEALLTMVAGLAVAVPPDRLSVVLLDGAGGRLEPLAALPHCRLWAAGGDLRAARAVEGAWRADAGDLLVVADGAGADQLAVLARIAAEPGRVRLVVAADRGEDHLVPFPAGPELGVDAGAASLRLPGAPARRFRPASISAPDAGRAAPVLVTAFPAADQDAPPTAGFDLDALVDAVRKAVAEAGVVPPPPLDLDVASAHHDGGGLTDLLGLGDIGGYDAAATWARPRPRGGLAVPLGAAADGRPLVLDLKEAALGGMGPHGLVAGATGSGKSEALRALVLSLALTHPPDELAFVLVDFKGGATFAGLADLPHVAGMITNLESDPALVDRMRDALGGEQRRRQALLRDAGNLPGLREYHERRAAGAPLDPLPSLLIVVDEFAELLAAEPEFVDVFVSIGRVGRSLGMHLLLASQRLEEGRLRGLDSHLSYRIALRTFSAAESRTVLGAAHAYELPHEPGWGYLKAGTDELARFRSAYVGAPTRNGRPLVDEAVDHLRSAAPRSHQVWLPPLDPVVPLDQVPDPAFERALAVPVGLVDRPAEQAVTPLVVDLAGRDANLAVVGAPQSGKSTLLRSLLLGLFRRTSPQQVQVYAIDYGGGTLSALEAAPHVGAVAGRQEPERVRRVVAEMERLLAGREQRFAEYDIDSAATFRARLAAGEPTGDGLGDVFLVIDNWPALRQAMEAVEPAVLDLAARGLGFGIHVLITANRWMDVRPNLRDSLGGRLELRLNDPGDSLVDRRTSQRLPPVAGRGLTPEHLQFQAALPRFDGVAGTEGLGEAVAAEAALLAAAWPDRKAPAVLLLPSLLRVSELPGPGADREPGVPIGVAERDLAPVYLELRGADPHFVVFGDGESGKTTFLRTLVQGMAARIPPRGVVFLVVDYRRTLLDAVPQSHLLGYAGTAPAAAAEMGRLRELVAQRQPPPDVTPAQLRDRSWWTGPEVVVVVDDYDLVVTPTGNPVGSMADALAQGRDLGVHLVLARRAAGASRALFEPVLQRVKDLGSPGLLLSGDRAEGPLLGPFRPTEQPPGRGVLVRRRTGGQLIQVAVPDQPRPD